MSKSKKTGRPTKLTPDVQDRIIQALQAGNYQDVACRFAGIAPATFYRWMEQGEDPDADPIYGEFREAVERAKSVAEVRSVAIIQQAAQNGTWQAAAWYLERSAAKRWGRQERVEHSGPEGGPITLANMAKLLREGEGGDGG